MNTHTIQRNYMIYKRKVCFDHLISKLWCRHRCFWCVCVWKVTEGFTVVHLCAYLYTHACIPLCIFCIGIHDVLLMSISVLLNQDSGLTTCQIVLERTASIKTQSLKEMACVALIKFNEMGSSYSLDLCPMLWSLEDDSLLCASLCV